MIYIFFLDTLLTTLSKTIFMNLPLELANLRVNLGERWNKLKIIFVFFVFDVIASYNAILISTMVNKYRIVVSPIY